MTGLNWRELGFQNQDLQDYGGFTGLGRCVASFCGYCLEASMTAAQASPMDCGSSPQ